MSSTISWFFVATVSIIFAETTAEDVVEEFRWSHINYTWKTKQDYQYAERTGLYKAENIFLTGVKLYGDRLYLATPNFTSGVPFTLSYVSLNAKNKTNTPLVPFPDASLQREINCKFLQNVQTLEIDTNGIMYVLDGVRLSTTKCPAKLQLFDLKQGGKLVHTYIFPNEICLQDGCHLNDIVLDNEGHAYITDSSNIDPGLIVYCWTNNTVGKFRDSSMFPGKDKQKFSIDNYPVETSGPINGIALSPIRFKNSNRGRTLYYSPGTGYDLYSIAADQLRNFTIYKNGDWRKSVAFVGKKQGSTDGMMMDNRGNLYYSLTSLNAIGKWNTHRPFNESEIFYKNETMVWPDSFGMDQEGYLYLVANRAVNYVTPNVKHNLTSKIKFRIFKFPTGNKSYQYL